MEKTIIKYGKIFQKVLKEAGLDDTKQNISVYEKRLEEMYHSENFKKHNIYPSTNTPHIYAVIAMCLELKKYNLTDQQIIDTINKGFSRRREFFRRLIRIIDRLPGSYKIAEKWNISDHEKREKDGSLTYEYFNVSDGKIEYNITKCIYTEMFETYGIRSLCKIFCMTDTTAYENLSRHVKFIRHSDLSDGNCCHDEIIEKRN
ncbi:MAG: L-2-amino-thiazoline-4-carboxylic acid hydrolase [Solobacterium sp.]|nr:L-2-amino-thiazoline-4-carboxylic acid hydrolase [Solobacterium sp.]